MKTSPLCLCLKNPISPTPSPSDDQKNIFTCIKCKNSFHISCYDNPTIQILNNTITCIQCRLEIIEPYWSLRKEYLVHPHIIMTNTPVDLSFKFTLPSPQTINEYSKIIFFCTKLKSTVTNNFSYEWPSDKFELQLNGNPIEYNVCSFVFLDALSLLKENELKVSCKENFPFVSVFGVALAKSVDVKEIAKEIAKSNRLGFDESKKKYEDMKQSDLEFSVGIPIKDPMSSFMLYMPARGLNCDHLACFDLMNFLNFNKSNYNSSRWKCPLCKSILNVTEIVIDLYLYKIVKEIRKDNQARENSNKIDFDKFSHIFFDEKGDWKPKDKFSNMWSKIRNFFKGLLPVILPKFLGQNNKTVNKEKSDVEIISTNPTPPKIEKEKLVNLPLLSPIEKTEKPKNTSVSTPIYIEIVEEDEEVKPQGTNYFQDCMAIIKAFLHSKCSKGESNFRILQTFQDNPVLRYLNFNQFYDLLEETKKIVILPEMTVLEGIYFQRKKKNIEEICNELKSSFGFELICKLILLWSNSKASMLKIIYLLTTKNMQKQLDIFKFLEHLLLISEILTLQHEENKDVNPENIKDLSELFGGFLKLFTENMQINNKENYKTFLKFISVLIPEFHFPKSYSEKNQKCFHFISVFLNSVLRQSANEDFQEIVMSLYPCSVKEPSFLDLMILKKQLKLWTEIFTTKDPKTFTNDNIWKIVQKWNENPFLKEQIEKGKLNISHILSSEV